MDSVCCSRPDEKIMPLPGTNQIAGFVEFHLLMSWEKDSPVPELSFLPAPYRGSTRAGERRVQDNLHAHAQSEPTRNDQKLLAPNHAARVNVSRNAFFSSRSERKHFLWRWYCRKKHENLKIEIWFIVLCTLIDNEYTSLLFSQTRKVWRVQVAHLHNEAHIAAHILSSPSRCFQLSTNLGKDFSRYLWYCDKNKLNVGWRGTGEIPLIWD